MLGTRSLSPRVRQYATGEIQRLADGGRMPDRAAMSTAQVHDFANEPRNLSVDTFVAAVARAGDLTDNHMLFALVLLRRLTNHCRGAVSDLNVRRLTLVCIILATKVLDDQQFAMGVWTRPSGFTLAQILAMEREALRTLQWNVNVAPELIAAELRQARTPVHFRARRPCSDDVVKALVRGPSLVL